MLNLVNKIFGDWKVTERLLDSGAHNVWKCECIFCGNISSIQGRVLRRKHVKGEGQLKCDCRKLRMGKNLSGKIVGKFKIISEEIRNEELYCVCECTKCNKIVKMSKGNLISIKDKGRSFETICGCELKRRDSAGYIHISRKLHPNSQKGGKIREHVYIMSQYLGRPLAKGECVHHINGIKDDNRIENLELWTRPHPTGIRVKDALKYALEILDKYKDYQNPTKLNEIQPDWFELEK